MIETARLRLRPPRLEDAPAVAALMTPGVGRWMGSWPVPFTMQMAQARIARPLGAIAAGRSLVCVVEHRGAFAGWIGEPHHGQALMQEAALARLALDSIEAACQPENHASARVLAACGLRRIGTRLHHAPARDREEPVDIWERAWTRDLPG